MKVLKDWRQVVKKLQVGEIMAVVEGPVVQEAAVPGSKGWQGFMFGVWGCRPSGLEFQF